MKKHYVCLGGCGGESYEPRYCAAEGCPKEDQPYVLCLCEDGLHKDAGKYSEEEGEEMSEVDAIIE